MTVHDSCRMTAPRSRARERTCDARPPPCCRRSAAISACRRPQATCTHARTCTSRRHAKAKQRIAASQQSKPVLAQSMMADMHEAASARFICTSDPCEAMMRQGSDKNACGGRELARPAAHWVMAASQYWLLPSLTE